MRAMRIGVVSTRLAGVDGVSFETTKWETALHRLGHVTVRAAGELPLDHVGGRLIPAMHFTHPPAEAVTTAAFVPSSDPDAVRREVRRLADELLPHLAAWLSDARIDVLLVQNAWAIPMQLPLGVALARLAAETGVPAIGHHHDDWWERERFATPVVPEILEEAFPPNLPNVRHVSINSVAAGELRSRRGIESIVIPNVIDFSAPPPERDDFSRSMRAELGMGGRNLLAVQPTRVVPRKGIELSIELMSRLHDPHAHLMITSPAGDEGMGYLAQLHMAADRAGVDLRYVADRFGPVRRQRGRWRMWSLADAYLEANLILYPSLYEGFGNALVEAVYFGKPLVVNRYSVYDVDIAPLGFRFVEIREAITDDTVRDVWELLHDPERRAADAAHNYEIGRRHLSYETLEKRLAEVLDAPRGAATR